MRWNNQGHEYDVMYKNMERINQIYLFGAGHDGAVVKHILSEKYKGMSIEGFIDNDMEKQGTMYLGLSVYALDEIKVQPQTAVVVTFASEFTGKIDAQLAEHGWTKNTNFFHYEEFISVLAAYRFQELFMPSIAILPTTRCNLRCKACLNFTTYIRQFKDRPFSAVKKDVDLFFQNVDYLGLLHISGGEPLLYPEIAKLVRYIDGNYGDRMYSFETVTNGTVKPGEDFLQALRDTRLRITVDDYREALPQFQEQIEENLERIRSYAGMDKVTLKRYEEWIDLYPYPQKNMGKEELVQKYDRCHVPWQEYRDGKLYTCNYAAFAAEAGLVEEPDSAETYDLSAHNKEKMKAAMEFRLGYSEKGYAEFCKKCAGYLEINPHKVKPAVQERRMR